MTKDSDHENHDEHEHDVHKDHDNEHDVNKIHKKKEELKERTKDNFIDNFNFWINVAFIILGILLFLTICLLIYSIFFRNSIINSTWAVSSSKPAESVQMPNVSVISTPTVVSESSTPLISSTPQTSQAVIVSDTKQNSSLFNSMFSPSKPPMEEIKTKPKSSSIFASFFSSSKKPEPSNTDITTNVDILNKNTSIEFKKPSVVSSFVAPLYDRKVELPQMKHTGGSYNKILKRF